MKKYVKAAEDSVSRVDLLKLQNHIQYVFDDLEYMIDTGIIPDDISLEYNRVYDPLLQLKVAVKKELNKEG